MLGLDAVLHMSRIKFEFWPTQINLGLPIFKPAELKLQNAVRIYQFFFQNYAVSLAKISSSVSADALPFQIDPGSVKNGVWIGPQSTLVVRCFLLPFIFSYLITSFDLEH